MFGMCWGLPRYGFKSSFQCLYSYILCESSCTLSKACTDMLYATVNEMQYDAIAFVRDRMKVLFVSRPSHRAFVTPSFLHVQLYHLVPIE